MLMRMALQPVDPFAAQNYARKKLPITLLIAVAFSLPAIFIALSFLSQTSFPHWLLQALVVLVLLAFFVFFFAMIGKSSKSNQLLGSLGLRSPKETEQGLPPDTAMLAERRGRILEYGISQKGNFWRCRRPAPSFQIENRGGIFFASPDLPMGIHALLSAFPKDRIWRHLSIRGDSEGMIASRPLRLAKFYLQDLWLLEKILDAVDLG